MSKFSEAFNEPFQFTNGDYILDGSIEKEVATELFVEFSYGEFKPERLGTGFIRYGFAPFGVEDIEAGGSCWFTCGESKGAQKVWIYG